MVVKAIREVEFYEQKLKEAKAKLQEFNWKDKDTKVINQKITDNWSVYQGDCISITKKLPSNSIHYSIFSPPFSSLFTYSASIRDMGNSTDKEFYTHFNFLIPELYRVIMPGRLVSIHCMNLPMTISTNGVMGMKDFRGDIIRAFVNQGFIYHSEVCIWKDPLVQATRTKALSLAHKQISKDSSRCNMGYPDYIVTMRKTGINSEPISHGRGFEEYIGERPAPNFEKNNNHSKNKYSHHVWQRYASPVWFDIRQGNTLNVKLAKEKNDERHICPLQLDVIARCLELWTNKGDIVLTPFGGIGSDGYQAVKMGRKAILIELKKIYYDITVKNLKSIGHTPKGFELDE
jgi:DNA modification methylase